MELVTRFRPCIDLHEGKVKQIVGGSLTDKSTGLIENFVSDKPADYYASTFSGDMLDGGHIIKLGHGNDSAAKSALAAFPGGLQLGGGINAKNASSWLDAGASKLIVTSWLFDELGKIQAARLQQLASAIGKDRLVIDLSCRQFQDSWYVVINRWHTRTNFEVSHENLDWLADSASEFLIHAVDVEGLRQGFDEGLVSHLGAWGKIPITYAGGITSLADVSAIEEISKGKIDISVGSALDLFGGTSIRYKDLVDWNRTRSQAS